MLQVWGTVFISLGTCKAISCSGFKTPTWNLRLLVRDSRLPPSPAQDQRTEGRDMKWALKKTPPAQGLWGEHREGARPGTYNRQTQTPSWAESKPLWWKIKKINYKAALSFFFFRSLSAYQLLISLCCGIKLQSWPEGTKGSRTEGQQQGRYHPKNKGKGSSQEVLRGKLEHQTANFGDRQYIF